MRAIWANKLRSSLTTLGNVVAVGSIIAVVSLIQGVNAEVSGAIVSEFGSDSFVVDREGLLMTEADIEAARNNPRISLDDADAIRRFSTSLGAIMAEATRSGEVRYRDRLLERVNIRGVTRDYIDFPLFTADRGRLISPTEVDSNRGVAVLGFDTANRLFDTLDPVDRTIKIQGVNFRVVGASEPTPSTLGQSQDEYVVIPMGRFRKLFGSRPSLTLMARPQSPEQLDHAINEATVALRIERRLRPREDNDFGVFTSGTVLGLYEQATAGIFAVLVGIVGLSLVVGGIVIMNIMLMVVSERTREIGLRKALGARRRDLLWQILAESIILSVLGGAIGTGLGFSVAIGLSSMTPVPAAVHPWSVLLGITMTAAVGLFFGLYPAARAASLDPISALGRS
ncbi:Macrolide export ATP-binding/permease protein MacB [Geodia barretti]|uniref:Macrolide export ATP-binding/permease protein MacB n=1 Tax=Geodia barretti TaxID=519541 RepID=A0AA35W2K2_GEOBA|nr:Macrolide export ATP-binding/permease protein MacB [Geodia barretti]